MIFLKLAIDENYIQMRIIQKYVCINKYIIYILYLADRMLCGHNKWKENEKNLSILRDRIKTDYTRGLGEKQRLSACPLCSRGTSGVNLFGVPAKVRDDLLFFVELLIQLSNARDQSSGTVLCIEIFFFGCNSGRKKRKTREKGK